MYYLAVNRTESDGSRRWTGGAEHHNASDALGPGSKTYMAVEAYHAKTASSQRKTFLKITLV
jgi:hypothetical protein